MKVMVRVDAGLEIGFAHVVRLQQFLQMFPRPLKLSVVSRSENMSQFFENAEHVQLGAVGSDGFKEIADRIKPDMFICDHPHAEHEIWQQVRWDENIVTVAIDDFGGLMTPDCVINGTVLSEYHNYPGISTSGLKLLGPKFALLRSEFGTEKWFEGNERSVLVIIGSGERARAWANMLVSEEMVWPKHTKVEVVVGWSFDNIDNLRSLGMKKGVQFSQGLSAATLATKLCKASVALMTGGMIVYEALACGVPSLVFPQERNLVKEMDWFASHNCVVNLGYDGGMDFEKISNQLNVLLDCTQSRKNLSSAGRKILDGRGTQRSIQEIFQYFQLH